MRLFRAITFLGKGSVAHCTLSTGRCSILSRPGDFNFANGITKPTIPRNIIYVAHTSTGLLTYHIFYNASSSGSPPILSKGIPIKVGMPMDNLCSDSNGDVYFAGLPDILGLMSGMEGEYPDIASSILKVSMENTTDGRIQLAVSKVMEDRDGKMLPAASGVCHDVKRNSFWMGSLVAPFITVCEDANPRIFKHIIDETIIVDESRTVEEAAQEGEMPRDEVFSSLYAGLHH
jgi:arylesterase/paraoxonase